MKTLVIYKSRTGFTKKYAQWISEELSCEAVDFNELSEISLNDTDMIIYGGRVHAGNVDGLNKIKKLAEKNNCRLIVFATGATPAQASNQIENMWKSNNIDEKTPHFYMQSGLRYEKMNAGDKFLMKIFSSIMKKKKNKNKMENGMTEAIQKSYDLSSKEFIKPLVEYVKKNERKI